MANELKVVKETETEVITVELDKALVKKFDTAYTKAGKSMRDMCILAYQICGEDTDARKLFQTHIVSDLGMSKSTASQLVNTGSIYINYPDTQIMSHTKCAELLPVRDDVNEFLTKIEMDVDELNTLSQAKIREKVKAYLNPTEDAPKASEKATEATEEAQDAEEAQDTQDTPQDGRQVKLEARLKAVYAELKSAESMLKYILDTYELDENDTKRVERTLTTTAKIAINDLV